MGDASPERKSGCGLLSAVFGRGSIWPKRSNSTGPTTTSNSKDLPAGLPSAGAPNSTATPPQQGDRIIDRPVPNQSKAPPTNYQHQQSPPVYNQKHSRQPPVNEPKKGGGGGGGLAQGYGAGQPKMARQGTLGLSSELDTMISDHQAAKGAGKFVRASSGNVMLFGNLGNLRQPGGSTAPVNNNGYDYNQPRNVGGDHKQPASNGKYSYTGVGNVVKTRSDEPAATTRPTSLCRALSTRMDPEQLKILGNEDYKNGRFEEALSLYDAAISIDPNKASYRSNKSAALTALGRLLEAVLECREAIRIEPFYQRAHNRLATLYVRLGEAEKAMYHYKNAGPEAEPDVLQKAKNIQGHLHKCTDAKKQRDWKTLLKESSLAISAGADSAPQIFALKADALLKLHKHQDADQTLQNGPNFDPDDCTKFFGPIGYATLLIIQAQVDMAIGRFDDAVAAAQRAARLDANNREVSLVARRTRAVGIARSKGNDLFKTGNYSDACLAYGEGLHQDPYNSVLLSNRAACRSKLGQYEKALEDCNAALSFRPNFSKARLRRADCFTKMQNWEACIQDCELLMRENPNDDVARMLKEAQSHLGKAQDVKPINDDVSSSSNVVVVSSDERFRDYVASPGISVVLFCNKSGDRSNMQFLEQLHGRYPSVNFFKVEVEDHPEIAKSEGVNSMPAFKIYRTGSKTKEIPGDSHDLLESTIKFYIS